MSLSDFLRRLTEALDRAEVQYMVCGSVASFFHGVPRTTQDVDLVVKLRMGELPGLIAQFPEEDFYVSESAAREAVKRRRQFNVIDMATGWKADLIVTKRRRFSEIEFGRRQRGTMMEVGLWVASAEDTVLAKLEWGKASGSERQLADARGIIAVQGSDLDSAYLEKWAHELGVLEELRALQQ